MFQNGSSSSSSSIAVSRQKVTRRREPLLAVGADKGRRTQPQLPIRPESLLATTPSALVPGPRSNTAPEKEKERTSTPLTRLQDCTTVIHSLCGQSTYRTDRTVQQQERAAAVSDTRLKFPTVS
ncbi:hypothetical protein AXG93_3507s1240 [Marchantia polymorpha subsp. ruderalis]|uniref:Uncharacterized protein n=1 Tax=Marchantia polymorpha subsp. ruderalis TaxID=1480154 RepID=A0A176VFU8_MARPO|nr:hypothetical protein AXG93_3507s1240 [Marchantia polymorpha subsp. ruderalis]